MIHNTSRQSLGQNGDSGYATAYRLDGTFDRLNMAATLIPISLLRLIVLAVAALFQAGSDHKFGNTDAPPP